MNDLKERIQDSKSISELDSLRVEIVKDVPNFSENQKLFIKQKNKIKRNGGKING